MAYRRKSKSRRPARSKVYRRGRVARRRLQPSFAGAVIPQSLHSRFSAVGKRRRTGPFSGTGSRSAFGASGSATIRKKRTRSAPVIAMQELTKSTKRVKMQPYKLSRIVNTSIDKQVTRFQILSNFDTNVGACWLANYQDVTANVLSPMAILDLGSIYQPSLGLASPPVLSIPYWNGVGATADLGMALQAGQNPDGTATGYPGFALEDTEKAIPGLTGYGDVTHACLDWVSLRMNLYGQRDRTTKFVITVFQITDDEVDPINGVATHLDRKALFQYLERPFIYSNLQQDWKGKKSGFKTIKEFTYNVAPMTTIDLNTTTGNIHEANVKVQINKRMDYMYTKTGSSMIGHAQADGLDYNSNTAVNQLHQSPKPKQNVFVAIRAFAPVRSYENPAFGPARSAGNSPSFDIICRRGMSIPSS